MKLAQEMRQLTDKAINLSQEAKYQRFLVEKKAEIALAMSLIKLQASEGKYSIELTFNIHDMDSWIDHLVKNGFDYVPDVEKAEYPNVKLKITWHGGINLIPFIKPE